MSGHPLKYLWAYKYHDAYSGINLHADQAAVNVNIWLTADEANLDPTSGGLVVFLAKVRFGTVGQAFAHFFDTFSHFLISPLPTGISKSTTLIQTLSMMNY